MFTKGRIFGNDISRPYATLLLITSMLIEATVMINGRIGALTH